MPGILLHVVRSIYNWSESYFYIICKKSSAFPVDVGLGNSCALLLVLVVIFKDRISLRGGDCLGWDPFADGVLLASSGHDVQFTVG